MKIKQITNFLEDFASLHYQESYDNSGLIIGDANLEVNSVLISLDCTESVIDEAIETGCNFIISHHPLIFKGLKKLNGSNFVQRTIIKAIKYDIAIYAMHTNLDNIANGVNAKIAEKLELKNCDFLLPKSEYENVGSGIIGELSKEKSTLDFLKGLRVTMKSDFIRHTSLVKKKVKRIAVCGGSGSFLLQNAIKLKADVFISSDFKYHDYFDADNHIIIADIGHYESEQFTKELIYDLLIENFTNFAVRLSQLNTNPIKYL